MVTSFDMHGVTRHNSNNIHIFIEAKLIFMPFLLKSFQCDLTLKISTQNSIPSLNFARFKLQTESKTIYIEVAALNSHVLSYFVNQSSKFVFVEDNT